MGRYLESGEKLNIPEKGTFDVKEVIGKGASCVVYLAEHTDAHGLCTEHLLKEYNPRNVEIYREENGELCLDSEEDREAYKQGLLRFEEGYKKQLSVRRELSGLKNVTSNIQEIYFANGTRYIDMTCNEGMSYEKLQEASLYDLLRRIKGLAKIIGYYHKAGLLHLDIKPQNIFAIPETPEMVILFDFDSVVRKEEVADSKILSYTQSWAAPEQMRGQKNLICEATDIFAIGESLFFKMFGRHSETEERRSFAEYEFDYEAELFKNVNPKVYRLLEEILHKTICRSIKERYQCTEDLIAALDEAIKLADPKEPYLKTNLPVVQNFFVGRDSEIEEIHQKLQENNVLFVSGVGGIGKSELVKNYAKKYREEYDAVIFAPVISDILTLIVNEKTVPVYNFSSYAEEQAEDYYERKLVKIRELSDDRTLLIVDNLDAEDERLQDILNLGSKVLITTRRDFTDYGYEQINISVLQNKQAVFTVFENYYTKALSEEDREIVGQIIALVDGHTMTVELLAKQMMAGRITPDKMLEKLQKGIQEVGREKVKSGKDGLLASRSAYEHIRTLFDISGLSEGEKYVLGNLSLLPYTGVPSALFYDWCELEDYDTINELVAAGWVRIEKESDYISLHPVVAEVAVELIKDKNVIIDRMLEGIAVSINQKRMFKYGFSLEHMADFLVAISYKLMGSGLEERSVVDFLFDVPNVIRNYGYDNRSKVIVEYCVTRYSTIVEENAELDCVPIKYKLGKGYFFLSDMDNAKRYFWEVLQDSLEYEEKQEITVNAYDHLGEICLLANASSDAKNYYENAYKLRKQLIKLGKLDERTLAISHRKFGTLYYKQLNYDKAEDNFMKALAYLVEDNDDCRRERLSLYNDLIDFYETFYEHEKAEKYYEKMDLELKMLKDNIVSDIYMLGRLARHSEDKSNYIYAAELAPKMFKEEKVGEFRIYLAAAGILYKKQDWKNAKKYYLKALEKIRLLSIENEITYLNLLINLSDVCVRGSDYNEADMYKKEIERFIEKYKKKDIVKAYFFKGRVEQNLSNYREAESYYIKAMDLCFECEQIEYILFEEIVKATIGVCVVNQNFVITELYARKSLDWTLNKCFGLKSEGLISFLYFVLEKVCNELGKYSEAARYSKEGKIFKDFCQRMKGGALKDEPDKLRDNRERYKEKLDAEFAQILEKNYSKKVR